MAPRKRPGVAVQAKSANRKLGPTVAATSAARVTCPPDCALWKVCYAAQPSPQGWVTARLAREAEAAAMDATALAEAEAAGIRELPTDGRAVRLHVVGDATTAKRARILAAAVGDWQARGGGEAWTYTHAWGRVPRDAWGPVSVLASCESEAQVRAARKRGYATALVVEKHAGRKDPRGIPCPEQTGAAPDCASCRLCWRADRLEKPILFEVHGNGAKHARGVVA